ncbi:MAG: Ig-like domain-containing protein, partial [Imperialibacter sp.]|uniref:Ig-like domain-containing protein n=1 Tax=Imperialibacter sp. TaxID=2038411 RepID=UPI0032EDDE18
MNVHLIFKSFGKRIKFCAIFFLAVITFSCVEVLAQNHEWVSVFTGASSIQANAITVDASGNVYTTGVFAGTADFDPGAGEVSLTSAGNNDIFITKLNASGALVWARKVGGTGTDEGLAIRVDASSNVLVSGKFTSTVDFDPGAGTSNLTATSTDLFVLKLNSAGDYVWAKRWGSNLGSEHIGLAVDGSGNVYTGGSFRNSIDFDPGAGTVGATSGASNTIHTFLVKLDASGNYVTGKSIGTPSFASATSTILTMDASSNIFIAGTYGTTNSSFIDFDPDAGVVNLSTTSGYFIAKYNSSLAYVSVAEAPPATITDLHADASGNILATGRFVGTKDFDPGVGVTNLVSSGSVDAYAFKLNAAFELLWAKNFGGTVDDQGFSIKSDASGNVYIAGEFFGTSINDFDPGAGTVTLTVGPNGYDGFILKLNSSGEYVWVQSLYGPFSNGYEKVSGAFVDGSNNLYFTGFLTNGTVDFNPGVGTDSKTAVTSDAFVLKWNQNVLTSQTITFNALPAKAMDEAPFALTATASSGLPVSYTSSNTGVATVSGSTVTLVAPGTTTITAMQSGNGTFAPASNVPQSFTVTKGNQTITFGTLPLKTFGDSNFTLSATASSGLSVSYASSNTGVATISGNTVTIVAAGTTNITASQAGNTNYNAAANAVQPLYVDKADQIITFSPFPNKEAGDPDFALSASVTSGLPITFTSSNTAVATISGNVVSVGNVGQSEITAWQYGNANYNEATPVSYILTVTSSDVTAPTISSFNPINNSTDVAVTANLVATFSEPIELVNTKIIQIVRYPELTLHEQYTLPSANVQVSGSTLTINPTNNFLNSAAYYVFIASDAITDVVGNPFAGIVSNGVWQFNTVASADITAPTISSLSPADNATGVAVNGDLVVTFSENIVANTGVITIRNIGGSIHSSYSANGGVSISNNTLTITPSFNLDASTEYYVDLGVGVVKDAAGNSFAGLNGNPNWTFTTQALEVSALSYAPANGNTNVAVSSDLSITFEENITIATGTISVHHASNGMLITSLTNYNGSAMTIDGATVSFDLPNDLPANTEVYVNVTSGYLRSAANSQKIWPGIEDNTSWRFTTGKLNQTISFSALPEKAFGEAPFALSATASSGLTVAYASSNPAVATVSGSTVTIVGVGTTTITASQAGNASYNAAANVPQTLTVNKAGQTITFAALPAKTFGDANFTLGATSSSGLSVSYTSSNTAVATVSG